VVSTLALQEIEDRSDTWHKKLFSSSGVHSFLGPDPLFCGAWEIMQAPYQGIPNRSNAFCMPRWHIFPVRRSLICCRKPTIDLEFRLLGICFLREGFEAALGPERRGEKGGYAHDEGPVKVGPTQEMDISMLAAVN
jgi:hypothetical protein